MATTIVKRATKGSPLTMTEHDNNHQNAADTADAALSAANAKMTATAALTAVAALTPAADRLPYFTGASAAALATFTAFARSIADDADASAVLSTLGFSTFAKTLIDDADAAAFLTTLGFSAFMRTLLDDTDAATLRGSIGAVQALTPYGPLSGANTLTQATHSNRPGVWSGATTAAQALPTGQARGDMIQVLNAGSVPVTFSNVSTAPGFKKSAQPGETFAAISDGTTWWSTTPRVNNVRNVLTDAATVVWDTDLSGCGSIILAGNRTLQIDNAQDGGVYMLWVTQDATGGRTLAQPAKVKKGQDTTDLIVSSAGGAVSLICYTYHSAKDIFLATIQKGIA